MKQFFMVTIVKNAALTMLQKVVTKWQPNSGYEYDAAAHIEVCKDTNTENIKYEVWISIKSKK